MWGTQMAPIAVKVISEDNIPYILIYTNIVHIKGITDKSCSILCNGWKNEVVFPFSLDEFWYMLHRTKE